MGEKQNETDAVVTPAMRRLLQRAIELRTTDAGRLAADLGVSENTVHTEWDRAAKALGTGSRFESVLDAADRGLVEWPLDRP